MVKNLISYKWCSWEIKPFFFVIVIFGNEIISSFNYSTSPWHYVCDQSPPDGPKCVKKLFDKKTTLIQDSLMTCKMKCHKSGLLWPQPTGKFHFQMLISNFDSFILFVLQKE